MPCPAAGGNSTTAVATGNACNDGKVLMTFWTALSACTRRFFRVSSKSAVLLANSAASYVASRFRAAPVSMRCSLARRLRRSSATSGNSPLPAVEGTDGCAAGASLHGIQAA
eukprot:CAMPEP_0183397040 /NCGR_PEP_ID=MMETSP0370-20130417/10333_1 /TAXON_ID=268820 /ORGANISM="Peridinium aciculiferum, Strain PAER-2" /LENGTH=111 /DNA_ID=CAMNT_0025577865 /DNA_START=62 /DNA_END=397 /DNA_ORIENTATION=-